MLILADVSSMYTCFTDMLQRRKSALMLKWLQKKIVFLERRAHLEMCAPCTMFFGRGVQKNNVGCVAAFKMRRKRQKNYGYQIVVVWAGKSRNFLSRSSIICTLAMEKPYFFMWKMFIAFMFEDYLLKNCSENASF